MAAQVIGTTEDGFTIWGGTSADRTALGVKPALSQFQEIGGNLYESNGSAWILTSVAGAALVAEASVTALTGGQSQVVTVSSTSAQSAAITTGSAVITPTVDGFIRQGANPTALSNGTDQFLLANNTYRVNSIVSGNKLAFISTGASGSLYISPGA